MANEIYKITWWGKPTKNGWGNSYYFWNSIESTWSKITKLWN